MRKTLSIMIIVILVANLVFFGLGRISTLLFWVIIGIAALLAKGLKKLD